MLHCVLVLSCIAASSAHTSKVATSRDTCLLSLKTTLSRSDRYLADEARAGPSAAHSHPEDYHAGVAQRWLDAHELAAKSLVGVNSLSDTQNVTVDHASESSAYSDELGKAENKTKCQQCALAEQELIEALLAAREAHVVAQGLSAALSQTLTDHTDSVSKHSAHREEFASKLEQIQESMSSRRSFDVVAALAEGVYPAAQRAQASEAAVEERQRSVASAQEEYRRAATVAEQADATVVRKQGEEREACASLGLPTTPAPTLTETTHVKGVFVFGLNLSSHHQCLGEVLFYDSEGAVIEASLANYQDESFAPGYYQACGLSDGQLTSGVCWLAGYHSEPVIEPPTPAMLDCTAGETRGTTYNYFTPQGATETCVCENGQYKGNVCRAYKGAQGCHWFIWELQRKAPVARAEAWARCRGRACALSFAEFSACSSADVTTCSKEAAGSSSQDSHAEKMDVYFTA